jgi:hypothetical protein
MRLLLLRLQRPTRLNREREEARVPSVTTRAVATLTCRQFSNQLVIDIMSVCVRVFVMC